MKTETLRLVLNIKDWIAKPQDNYCDQNHTKDYWRGDIFEFEIFLMLNDGLTGAVIDKGEDCKDNGELWNADAGAAEGVDDCPGMAEPGDFGENQAASKGGEQEIVVVGLN